MCSRASDGIMQWIMQIRGVGRSLQWINMHQIWAWRQTDRKTDRDIYIYNWLIDWSNLYLLSLSCTQWLISWLSLCLSQGSTKVNYLHWQLKWLRPGKKKKKKERRHHPSSLWLPFSSAFPKVTGRSVFLLTHQYFRALHMECSSDFEYRARAYTSSLFLSDMTSSNAQWKLENRCIEVLPPPTTTSSPNEIWEGICWKISDPL